MPETFLLGVLDISYDEQGRAIIYEFDPLSKDGSGPVLGFDMNPHVVQRYQRRAFRKFLKQQDIQDFEPDLLVEHSCISKKVLNAFFKSHEKILYIFDPKMGIEQPACCFDSMQYSNLRSIYTAPLKEKQYILSDNRKYYDENMIIYNQPGYQLFHNDKVFQRLWMNVYMPDLMPAIYVFNSGFTVRDDFLGALKFCKQYASVVVKNPYASRGVGQVILETSHYDFVSRLREALNYINEHQLEARSLLRDNKKFILIEEAVNYGVHRETTRVLSAGCTKSIFKVKKITQYFPSLGINSHQWYYRINYGLSPGYLLEQTLSGIAIWNIADIPSAHRHAQQLLQQGWGAIPDQVLAKLVKFYHFANNPQTYYLSELMLGMKLSKKISYAPGQRERIWEYFFEKYQYHNLDDYLGQSEEGIVPAVPRQLLMQYQEAVYEEASNINLTDQGTDRLLESEPNSYTSRCYLQ